MAKQERTRKSAPQNKVQAFLDAANPIEAPISLNPEESRWFDAIISSRERSTWLDTDIGNAVQLAKLQVLYQAELTTCMSEGLVLDDRMNARLKVTDILFGQIERMGRRLGLSASQRGISGRKQDARNQKEAEAKEVGSNISSLIARPSNG